MTELCKGGLIIPMKMRIVGPWVVLTATSSQLEFRMGFRLFGPWRMDRSAVRECRCPA